jgi:hypothetical protein
MPERSTETLLQELSRDLAPVKPLPSLRVTACVLACVFALGVALSGALGLPLPGLAPGVPWASTAFLAVALGLVALALGGLTAGLAGSIPGRGALEQAGRRLAWAGLGICAAAALVWCLTPGALRTEVPLSATWMFFARAGALAALPALAASIYLARADEHRLRMGAVWLWLGAVALGASAVHASCSAGGAPHILLGHLVEPLVAAALGGVLIAPWLRRGVVAPPAA